MKLLSRNAALLLYYRECAHAVKKALNNKMLSKHGKLTTISYYTFACESNIKDDLDIRKTKHKLTKEVV